MSEQPDHLMPPTEPPLSLEWMARLVEIAHQTSNAAIRDGALRVLIRALNPMLRVRMDS